MPRPEAMAAVIFKITRVEDRLLCGSEKIIMEFAIADEIIIAKIKYLSDILYSICFSADRSNHWNIYLWYKDFVSGQCQNKHKSDKIWYYASVKAAKRTRI
ncbi:MAG: hypothetical protein WBE61_14730 [Nitrososphaeraceae archaeon]